MRRGCWGRWWDTSVEWVRKGGGCRGGREGNVGGCRGYKWMDGKQLEGKGHSSESEYGTLKWCIQRVFERELRSSV